MECLETEQILSKSIPAESTTTSPIFGCQFHNISFVVSEQGQVVTLEETLERLYLGKHFLEGIKQAVVCCSKSPEECNFYLRTTGSNTVYQLSFDLR